MLRSTYLRLSRRIARFVATALLLTTQMLATMPAVTAAPPVATDDLALNHVTISSHLDVSGSMEFGPFLAANDTNLGFFAADLPGANAYDGGWAIVDLDQLNAGYAGAVKSFQSQSVTYRAGGVSESGHFAALRHDARPSAEFNRNDVAVYTVSDPTKPELYGTYKLAKPAEVFENKIHDLVVYANRAYLAITIFSANPAFAFNGIIILDLTSPDPTTKVLPEISRHAYGIGAELLVGTGSNLYSQGGGGTIYGFDLSTGLSSLGTYAAGTGFSLDIAYGADRVIGRLQTQPTLLDFGAGSFGSPVVTPIQGETFVASDMAGELILATGRSHDVVLIRPEAAGGEIFGLTAGSVDVTSIQASSLANVQTIGSDFLFRDGKTDLYRLSHDGWQPHVELAVNSSGVEVNGSPAGQGQRITIASGDTMQCQGQATFRQPGDSSGTNSNCSTALDAICTDRAAFNLFADVAVFQAASHCAYLVNANWLTSGELGTCIVEAGNLFTAYYWVALSKLCRSVWQNPTPTLNTVGNLSQTSDAALRTVLSSGSLQAIAAGDPLDYAVETSHASAVISGTGTLRASHLITSAVSVFEATDVPMTITPSNTSLPPFTLQPGQIVGVAADEVLPIASANYTIYLPFLHR